MASTLQHHESPILTLHIIASFHFIIIQFMPRPITLWHQQKHQRLFVYVVVIVIVVVAVQISHNLIILILLIVSHYSLSLCNIVNLLVLISQTTTKSHKIIWLNLSFVGLEQLKRVFFLFFSRSNAFWWIFSTFFLYHNSFVEIFVVSFFVHTFWNGLQIIIHFIRANNINNISHTKHQKFAKCS